MIEPLDYRIEAKHRKRFKRLITSLNKLMTEVREYEPEATWYLQEDHMHLILGNSHSGVCGDPNHDLVALQSKLDRSSGGGW